MSRIKTLAVLLSIVVLAGVATLAISHRPASTPTRMTTDYKTTTLHIGTATIVAEIADTPTLRERGLGGRTRLGEGQGMWFVFDTDGLWQFWMKDTLIPLDMVWVDASSTIVTIAHDVRPDSYPKAFGPVSPARYVLELPGGYAGRMGIVEGMRVSQE